MSKVKKKDVSYPYVNLIISLEDKQSADKFIGNLKAVLKYIGSDEDVIHRGESRILGRAYAKIFRRLNPNRFHKYYRKISKRQIKQLLRCYSGIDIAILKVPYLVDYIFRAIFELVRIEKDSGRDLTVDVCNFVGDIRRNDFYKAQAKLYEDFCREYPAEINLLRENLNNDINGEKSALAKRFI